MPDTPDPIEALLKRRDEAQNELDALLNKVTDEKRSEFTETEDENYKRSISTIKDIDVRVGELRQMRAATEKANEARRLAGSTAQTTSTQVNEPDMYARGSNHSYFQDLGKRAISGDMSATDRLERHGRYEAEKRALGNTNATGGSGGEFAPPAWLEDQWIGLIRPGRVTLDLYNKQDMPTGVSSINLPKILTGVATAVQSTQNTALAQVDLTTSFVSTGFATVGGKELVAQQLLDQSAVAFDQVILNDLAASYAQQAGTLAFTGTGVGTGTNSVVNGLQNATIGSTQTWTSTTPSAGGFYGQAGALLSKFLGARLMNPTCWVMHPRRWFWLASATDPNSRPYVVPTGNAYNPLATEANGPVPMGYVGTMHGLPVIIDPLVPTNVGSGTNQDVVYLLKTDDLMLFESAPRAEAFRETYADSIGVLFRLYCYIGTMLNRHAESLGVLTGSGLVTPSFAS